MAAAGIVARKYGIDPMGQSLVELNEWLDLMAAELESEHRANNPLDDAALAAAEAKHGR